MEVNIQSLYIAHAVGGMSRSLTYLVRKNALDDIRQELASCSKIPRRAIRVAAKYGYIDVVRMLHEEYGCHIDQYCIVAAIRSHDFEVVKYCFLNTKPAIGIDSNLLYLYLKSGETGELEKLLEKMPLDFWDFLFTSPADFAEQESNVHALEWMLHYNKQTRDWVYTLACRVSKKRKVALFLQQHGIRLRKKRLCK